MGRRSTLWRRRRYVTAPARVAQMLGTPLPRESSLDHGGICRDCAPHNRGMDDTCGIFLWTKALGHRRRRRQHDQRRLARQDGGGRRRPSPLPRLGIEHASQWNISSLRNSTPVIQLEPLVLHHSPLVDRRRARHCGRARLSANRRRHSRAPADHHPREGRAALEVAGPNDRFLQHERLP